MSPRKPPLSGPGGDSKEADLADNPYEPLSIFDQVPTPKRFQTTPPDGFAGLVVFMAVLHGLCATVCAIGISSTPDPLLFGGISGFGVVSAASLAAAVGFFMRRSLAVRVSLVLFAVTATPLAMFSMVSTGIFMATFRQQHAVSALLAAAISSPFVAGCVFSLQLIRKIDQERSPQK